MIRARAGWWTPLVRVSSERLRWRVQPDPPGSAGLGRFASSGWDGAWKISSEVEGGASIGTLTPVRAGGVGYQIGLRGELFDLPNTRPVRELLWRGQTLRLTGLRMLSDERGVPLARFHGRWLGVNAETSRNDLEELVGVLAVAITLIGVGAAA